MWLSEYLSSFLIASNLYLGYYIVRYHKDHFIHHHVDSLLTSATYLRQAYRKLRPLQKPKIQVTRVHLLMPTRTTLIDTQNRYKPTELVVFTSDQVRENSRSDEYYHICYLYQDKPYRIVIRPDQMELLDHISDESQHPMQELEEVNFSHTEEPESLDLMEQYAGPLGDFYSYLGYDLPLGPYLLTTDCQNYLLSSGVSQVKVSNLLGDESVFSL